MRRIVGSLFLLGLFAANASAHAVGVDCTLRKDKIEVEVFYGDDTPAQKAKIELVNANDKVVESAVTDKDGRCVLRRPTAGKYAVRVDAGAGHRTKKKIDVPAANAEAAEPVPPAAVEEGSTSESLVRAEFTRFPWERLLIGFVVICVLGFAFSLVFRLRLCAREAQRALNENPQNADSP